MSDETEEGDFHFTLPADMRPQLERIRESMATQWQTPPLSVVARRAIILGIEKLLEEIEEGEIEG